MANNEVPIYCVFGWPSEEDSPDLLCAWDVLAVERDPDGWAAEPERVAAATGVPLERIRLAQLLVDWDEVECLFDVPVLKLGELQAVGVHPLVDLARWLLSLDEPDSRERQTITMQKILGRARDALDLANEPAVEEKEASGG